MTYIYILTFSLVIGAFIGAAGVVSLGSHRDNIRGPNGRLALGTRRVTGLHTQDVVPPHEADLCDHETVRR